MQLSSKIKDKLQQLPDKPGVYIMRDRHGRIIYVGKAASLRNRVRSYFQKGTQRSAPPKVRGMIKSIDDFETLVVRTEAEAVLTEGRLIKEYRPRYNITFRDDKRFLLLRIDLREPYPRLQTCRIRKRDGAHYFGPYASSASARAAREFCEKRFGLRVCSPREPGPDHYRHCLNDIIRFCSAPCIGRISREGYHERVAEAAAFLRGERPEILQELKDQMADAADRRDFERAAALRDTFFLVREAVRKRVNATRGTGEQADRAREGVAELQGALGLAAAPRVIECFDISNISGTHAVGSMVTAVDGVPHRNRYRRFRIRTVAGIDDPGMMGEVVTRRYSRLQAEGADLPGLVLVDGGITQLRAARAALDALGLAELPAAGLAKRFEELVTDPGGQPQNLRLPEGSAALHLVQRIRDEAHRFALTYHRALRRRRIQESVLDEIPGIGEKRKRKLLEAFGSMQRLRRASADEVAAVPGIGQAFAREVCAHLARARQSGDAGS